jgi:hypothetical protein
MLAFWRVFRRLGQFFGEGLYVCPSRPMYSVIGVMVWLSVCVHLMNQNEYPAHSEAVLAALPIRATRILMDGNHTNFFNSKAENAVRAVSHKV